MSLLKPNDYLNEKTSLDYTENTPNLNGGEIKRHFIECQKENQYLKEELIKLQNTFKQSLLRRLEENSEEEKFLYEMEKQYNSLKVEYEKQQTKLERLKVEHSSLKKQYNSLRNSKLGRITFKYWTFRKRLRKRVGR